LEYQVKGWAKSPTYILREDAILKATRDCKPGTFLEIGAGTGELTHTFIERGFSGYAYDLGDATRAALRERFRTRSGVRIIDELSEVPDFSLEYLFAFEVLEHIREDAHALASWCKKLKPGGHAVFSVPAHQRSFGPTDRRVGHIRRYNRDQLRSLIEGAGLGIDTFLCYGFPLTNLTRMIGNLIDRVGRSENLKEPTHLSVVSGTEQSRAVVAISALINRWTLFPFLVLQRMTLSTDLGEGYVVRSILKTRI
jgi:SAM-dependent methyltransferase